MFVDEIFIYVSDRCYCYCYCWIIWRHRVTTIWVLILNILKKDKTLKQKEMHPRSLLFSLPRLLETLRFGVGCGFLGPTPVIRWIWGCSNISAIIYLYIPLLPKRANISIGPIDRRCYIQWFLFSTRYYYPATRANTIISLLLTYVIPHTN